MTALFRPRSPDTLPAVESRPGPVPDRWKRPPVADPNIMGTRCDHSRDDVSHLAVASHEGCPGWWGRHINDRDALTCACSCHEEQGWPHWEQALERLGIG